MASRSARSITSSSSGGTKRRSVARNAIGAGSASARRSSSSRVSRPTRSTTAVTRSAVVGGRRTGRQAVADQFGPAGRAGRSTGADPVGALAVVAAAQLRVAQPVVGDVDPLRELEGVGAGDVRVVLAQETTPGKVDRLGAGVAGHPETGIQVVAGEGLAWRHDADIVVVRPGPSRYAQAMRPMAGGESRRGSP